MRKIHRDEVVAQSLPGRVSRELVSHKVLESKGVALRLAEVSPVKETGPRNAHSHPAMEEVIYVEKGRGKAWVEGVVTPIKAGDSVLVSPGERHMMINTGRTALVLVCAFSQCDPENHYREHPEVKFAG